MTIMNNERRKTVFILAAGMGTRLKDLTQSRPKAMVSVNGKPMLQLTMENLINQGFNHIVINVHHYAEQIVSFVRNINYENVTIEISDESDELMDTGGAILKALPYFKNSDAVLIHNVDIICDIDFMSYYQSFTNTDDAAWLFTQNRRSRRLLLFDDDNLFKERIIIENEEESHNYAGHLYAFSGLHLIKPQYFEKFDVKPCYVFDLYAEIAKENNVKSMVINPLSWFDIGTEEKLKEAESWLLQRR